MSTKEIDFRLVLPLQSLLLLLLLSYPFLIDSAGYSALLLLLLLLINYYLCEFLLFSLPYTPEGSGPNHGPRAQQG